MTHPTVSIFPMNLAEHIGCDIEFSTYLNTLDSLNTSKTLKAICLENLSFSWNRGVISTQH